MKKETLDAMRAWLDGEMLEYRPVDSNLKWCKVKSASECSGLPFLFDDTNEYRIKPRTIRIGEYEVPAPLPVDCGKLNANTTYYSPDIESMDGTFTTEEQFWCWDRIDVLRLERGLVHLSRKAAEIHAKALISLTGNNK